MEAIPNTWQTWAVDPLSNALTLIHDAVGSYAIAIVLFTVLIRLLMTSADAEADHLAAKDAVDPAGTVRTSASASRGIGRRSRKRR